MGNKQKKLWMIIGSVAVIIIVILVFAMLLSPSGENGQSSRDDGTKNLIVAKGPLDVYKDYKKEFDSASNFDSYVAVTRKYGTAAQVAKISEIEELSAELKEVAFSLAKSIAPSYSDLDIDNAQETISGNSATILINSKDRSLKGTITMEKEGGSWKIKEDSWRG